MRTHDLENDSKLQRVLWACHSYWQTEPLPAEDRVICYKWVLQRYRTRFAVGFHQSRLNALTELGLLTKHDTSRAGNRRYYAIQNPENVEALLRKWSLNRPGFSPGSPDLTADSGHPSPRGKRSGPRA